MVNLPSGRTEFKAYNEKGELQLHSWAVGSAADAEKQAFQSRLDRFDLAWVDVWPARGPTYKMWPQR